MDKISQEALNSAFTEMLETPEETKTLAEAGVTYIKQRLREESFTRKIIPPQNITKYDCQRSLDTDTVQKVVDIEPHSTAMAINFRSETPGEFIEGARYAIPFFTVSTPLYEKTEEELLAYEMPVVKIIEDNSVKDIQEAEDEKFIAYCGVAANATGQQIVVTDAASMSDKKILTAAFKMLDGGPGSYNPGTWNGGTEPTRVNKLHTATILMNTGTFNDVLALSNEQVGTPLNSEIFKDGYAYHQLLGKKLIVTSKSNLVPYGQIYVFAEQKYFGNFFILNNTKFWIEKRANLIQWKTWEVVGLGIGNIYGVARLSMSSSAPTGWTNYYSATLSQL